MSKESSHDKLDPQFRLQLAIDIENGGKPAKKALKTIKGLGNSAMADLLRNGIFDWSGLYRKEPLENQVEKIIKSPGVKGLVVFTDIVDFKEVNDEYGQSIGDDVIKLSAEALLGTIRNKKRKGNKDTLTQKKPKITDETGNRIGGDEFVLVLPGGESLLEADHEAIVRAKIEKMMHHKPLMEKIGELGLEHYGVRATWVLINHANFDEIVADAGTKETWPVEYGYSMSDGNLTVVDIK